MAYRDSREYYLIGYRPTSKKGRRPESTRLEIQVTRPHLQVRHRAATFGGS